MERLARNLICFLCSAIISGSFVFLSASWEPSSKKCGYAAADRSLHVANATYSKQNEAGYAYNR